MTNLSSTQWSGAQTPAHQIQSLAQQIDQSEAQNVQVLHQLIQREQQVQQQVRQLAQLGTQMQAGHSATPSFNQQGQFGQPFQSSVAPMHTSFQGQQYPQTGQYGYASQYGQGFQSAQQPFGQGFQQSAQPFGQGFQQTQQPNTMLSGSTSPNPQSIPPIL